VGYLTAGDGILGISLFDKERTRVWSVRQDMIFPPVLWHNLSSSILIVSRQWQSADWERCDSWLLCFADNILIFTVLKHRLLLERETKGNFVF